MTTWTKQTPTEPGDFWVARNDGYGVIIVRVTESYDGALSVVALEAAGADDAYIQPIASYACAVWMPCVAPSLPPSLVEANELQCKARFAFAMSRVVKHDALQKHRWTDEHSDPDVIRDHDAARAEWERLRQEERRLAAESDVAWARGLEDVP